MWLALLLACTSPLDTGDARDSDTEEPDPEPVAEPTFADIAEALDEVCRGCHTSAFPHGEMVLHTSGYANLVNRPSTQVPSLSRIEPGSLDDSYLWHKLQASHRSVGGQGESMPPVGRIWPDWHNQTLLNWIEQGAPL